MDSKTIYLLYGEETFLLENELNKIMKQFGEKVKGINYIQLDSTNVSNIIQDLETPAFGYPSKLIIVRDSQLFKKAGRTKKDTSANEEKKNINSFAEKISDYIKENNENINGQDVLVFVESEADKNSLYKTIEKFGNVKEFSKLKGPEAEKKVKSICNMYKVNIDGATTKYFVEACGTDMQILINEIRKQIEFAGENGTVTRQSIDKLCIKELDSVIFDLTDNLGKKNIKESLKILSNMIYEREPIQKILITLYNHFKKLYYTKIAINENKNIAETLKLKPNQMFLANKYRTQSQYFKQAELESLLQELIDLDYNFKQGIIDEYMGLEAILCKYCS